MALDGPQDNDETFNEHGVTFVIEKQLFQDAKPISIDFVESAMGAGFLLKSGLSKGDDCCASSAGGCGSGCAS